MAIAKLVQSHKILNRPKRNVEWPTSAGCRVDCRWRGYFLYAVLAADVPSAQSSPVVAAVRDGGIITSLNPSTGTLLKGRTREALGEYYASLVAADGKVFLSSSEGKITVLKARAQWETLSVKDMQEEVHGTPALSEGRINIRTRDAPTASGQNSGGGTDS